MPSFEHEVFLEALCTCPGLLSLLGKVAGHGGNVDGCWLAGKAERVYHWPKKQLTAAGCGRVQPPCSRE